MKYILILSMLWCSAFCSGQRSEHIHYSGTDMTKSRGYYPIGKSDTIPIYTYRGIKKRYSCYDTVPKKNHTDYFKRPNSSIDTLLYFGDTDKDTLYYSGKRDTIMSTSGVIISDTIIGGVGLKVFTYDSTYVPNIKWQDTVYTDTTDPNKYQRGGWADYDSKGKIVDSVTTYFILPDFELVNKYIIYSYRNVPEFGLYYYEGIVSRTEEWNVFKSAVLFNRELMFEYVELRYHDGGSFATHYINRKLIDRAIKKY